jgi:hypothetical protein
MNKFFALLALLWPVLGLTQSVQQQAAEVATPEAPVPAVPYRPLEAVGVSALVQELEDWKAANATVGRYHGHNDIIQWERAQDAERAKAMQEPAR